jgi:RNA polymerase sigma-70 factor, ECF subfamily
MVPVLPSGRRRALPAGRRSAAQRTVISLRDIEGWPFEEVCSVLEISDGNQRVVLHRARAKMRNLLEAYFARVPAATGRLG